MKSVFELRNKESSPDEIKEMIKGLDKDVKEYYKEENEMKEIRDVNEIINDCECLTLDELMLLNNNIVHMIRYKRAMRDKSVIEYFAIGDKVIYNHRGIKREGEVIKINRKTVRVKECDGVWNVPASMLEIIEIKD